LTRRENGIRVSNEPVRASKLSADFYLPWQGICLDAKRLAALYMLAIKNALMNSFGNGLEISGYTLSASFVPLSEGKYG
jgi:hypothetical protein